MSDETKPPTKEDVERWHDNVLEMFEGREQQSACLIADLARLKSAALLGVQVPGLREELTGMTANFDRAANGLVLATKQVSALQAQVAELQTASRDAFSRYAVSLLNSERHCERLLGAGIARAEAAEADRDALRAQVAEAQALATAVIRTGGSEEGERLANDIRAALSAPPAETPTTERCATGNTCVCGDCPNADE